MQITSAVAEARKEGGEWQGPLANPLKMAAIASHPTLGENLMEDKRRRLHLSLLLFSIKSFSPPSESDFILCPLSVRVCLWGAAATLLMLRAKKGKGRRRADGRRRPISHSLSSFTTDALHSKRIHPTCNKIPSGVSLAFLQSRNYHSRSRLIS